MVVLQTFDDCEDKTLFPEEEEEVSDVWEFWVSGGYKLNKPNQRVKDEYQNSECCHETKIRNSFATDRKID